MIKEKREKTILRISFLAGLVFAIVELLFALYSRSQSTLTDALYDMSELVFIALLIFITPLFYKEITEEKPYGYFQVETVFVVIKAVMMLSVSISIFADVIDTFISGGNHINSVSVSIFQLILGTFSLLIYFILKKLNHNIDSPTIKTEILGWKLDVFYSLGMAFAFFTSKMLENTSLSVIVPYFDQIITIVVMVLMLPESIKVLIKSLKDVCLFSPDRKIIDQIKELSKPVLEEYDYHSVFYDITKTGRHLWISLYFNISSDTLDINSFNEALEKLNTKVKEIYEDATCELILVPITGHTNLKKESFE